MHYELPPPGKTIESTGTSGQKRRRLPLWKCQTTCTFNWLKRENIDGKFSCISCIVRFLNQWSITSLGPSRISLKGVNLCSMELCKNLSPDVPEGWEKVIGHKFSHITLKSPTSAWKTFPTTQCVIRNALLYPYSLWVGKFLIAVLIRWNAFLIFRFLVAKFLVGHSFSVYLYFTRLSKCYLESTLKYGRVG